MRAAILKPQVSACLTRPTRVVKSVLGNARPFAPVTRTAAPRAGPFTTSAVASTTTPVVTRERVFTDHPMNNITENIYAKIGVDLHKQEDNPLCILKQAIFDYFDAEQPGMVKFDSLEPIVGTVNNFDEVLVPKDHVSRSMNDTYYVDEDTVLRCHTSAHQAGMLRDGERKFLVVGDVYRRDSIDATHYPVFHQMEGVRVFEPEEWEAAGVTGTELAEKELKATLEGLAKHLFGDVECRWVDAYFPFTEPSFELEIFYMGDWLEVLGCGVMQQQILDDAGCEGKKAWAFGLGLERLAMVMFSIPDIRLFWTDDKRFTKQFKKGDLGTKFAPYSKYPPVYKDVSFWTSPDFTENNLCEVARAAGGDLIEEVKLIDEFENKKVGKVSNCFRIMYRSMERTLENSEIDEIQAKIRAAMEADLGVELR